MRGNRARGEALDISHGIRISQEEVKLLEQSAEKLKAIIKEVC